jgi:hypothetical protein
MKLQVVVGDGVACRTVLNPILACLFGVARAGFSWLSHMQTLRAPEFYFPGTLYIMATLFIEEKRPYIKKNI